MTMIRSRDKSSGLINFSVFCDSGLWYLQQLGLIIKLQRANKNSGKQLFGDYGISMVNNSKEASHHSIGLFICYCAVSSNNNVSLLECNSIVNYFSVCLSGNFYSSGLPMTFLMVIRGLYNTNHRKSEKQLSMAYHSQNIKNTSYKRESLY